MSLEINFILDIIVPFSLSCWLWAVHILQLMICVLIWSSILRVCHLSVFLQEILLGLIQKQFRILLPLLQLHLTNWYLLRRGILRWTNRISLNRVSLIVIVDILHWLFIVRILLNLMILLHVVSTRFLIFIRTCNIVRKHIETQAWYLSWLFWLQSRTVN